MPIKGLSETRRFTRGGHLRLGRKVQGQRSLYPEKSDHFIADFESPEVTDTFHRIYGAEPKRVTIAFGADEAESIFPQYYKCYGSASGLKCKGDGETAGRANAQGEIEEVECPTPQHCDFAKQNGSNGKPGCKQMASLQFFIKGLPGIQVFQVNTTSFNSIVNINTGIELLQTVRRGRSIRGVWVDLCLVPQSAQAAGKAVTIFVLKLDIPVSLDNLSALECAFDAPAALPAPDESRDEYLTPTATAATAQHPPELQQEFAAACEAVGKDVADAVAKLKWNHGVTSWHAIPLDAIREAIAAMHAQYRQDEIGEGAHWEPGTDTTPANSEHPLYQRLHHACQRRGLDTAAEFLGIMQAHDCVDAGDMLNTRADEFTVALRQLELSATP